MRCDSEIDHDCAVVNDPFEFVESCIGTPYAYAARGCFTMNKSGYKSTNHFTSNEFFLLLLFTFLDGFTVRGCINELSDSEYVTCQANDLCKICRTNICNIENKAFQTLASALILLSLVIVQTL